MNDLTGVGNVVYTISNGERGYTALPMSEALYRAQRKYETETSTAVKFRLNKVADADIIDRLNSVPDKTGYIKALIRKDIKGGD